MPDEKVKAAKLREMSRTELETALRETREELWNIEFRRITQEAENPLRIRRLRRQIARVTTLLHEDATGIRKVASQRGGVAAS